MREEGYVKWFDPMKNYGFITRDSGKGIVVHTKDLQISTPLREGQRVSFLTKEDSRGLHAVHVILLEEGKNPDSRTRASA